MKRVKRTFTQDEKDLVFELWKQGTDFGDIGRVLKAAPGTVFTALRESGGIKPRPQTRNAQHLTLAEREEIRVALSLKMSLRAIARMLGRSPSTISREIFHNRGRRYYKAVDSDNRAKRMAKRPKLELNWSPEKISGWLRVEHSRRKNMQVSHETIYKSIYVRSKGVIHHSFTKHLRRGRPMRHSRYRSRSGDRSFTRIVNGVSIHERSKNIENRKSLGHWEGDLVSGSQNTHIATLVDRKSRCTIILKLKGKDADSVHQTLLATFNKMPKRYTKSLTWDRGMCNPPEK